MSIDFSLTEEVKMKLVDSDNLVFVGFLHEFQWAPGHGPEEGIKMLEVEPRRKEPERRGLIAYEVQERRGSSTLHAAASDPPLRLAEAMLGVSVNHMEEVEKQDEEAEAGARVSEWDGERIIVYMARDGQLHAIQMQCPHALAFLAGGEIEDYSLEGCRGAGPFVSCPSHTYIFDVSTGVCVSGPDKCKPARTYYAEAGPDGGVYVSRDPNPERDNKVPLEVGFDIQMRLVEKGLNDKMGFAGRLGVP